MTLSDIRVSSFANAHATRGGELTLSDIATQVRSDKYAAQIAAVRSAPDKATADALKIELPAFTPSGTFHVRNRHALKSLSAVSHADLDDLTPARIAAVQAKATNDPHCLLYYRSPRGKGLKLFFACDPSRPHDESWQAMAAHVRSYYGEEPDPKTKDLSRMCFLSHDPEAFVAPGSVLPLSYPPTAAMVQQPPKKTEYVPLTASQIRELLTYIRSKPPYDVWIKVVGAVAYALPEAEGIPLLKDWSAEDQPGEYEQKWAHALSQVTPGTLIFLAQENGWKPSLNFKIAQSTIDAITAEDFRAWLQSNEFGVAPTPAVPVARFYVGGVPICTPGNLTSIFAQAKTGKTSFISAMIAAAICAEFGISGCDCLGITSSQTGGRVLLHLDSEQAPYDHERMVMRALTRAGVTARPPWLRSFRLAGAQPNRLLEAVRRLLDEAEKSGGAFAFIIDGIADLAVSVNDEEAVNALVAELHALATLRNPPKYPPYGNPPTLPPYIWAGRVYGTGGRV